MDRRALGRMEDEAGVIASGQVYASRNGSLIVVAIRSDRVYLTDGWRCLVIHDYDDVPTPAKAGKVLCYRGSFLELSCERIA